MLIDIPFWRIPPFYLDKYLNSSIDKMRSDIKVKEAELIISQVAYPLEEHIPGMNSKAHLIGILLKMQEPSMHKLYRALKEDNVILIKEILQEKDTNKIAVLLGASSCNSLNIVKLLVQNFVNIDESDDLGWTALITSIVYGNVEIFRELIKNGADINNHTFQKVTPLMIAVSKENVAIVQDLLKNKANIHAQDIKGNTAMNYSEIYTNAEIIKLLREAV